MAIDMKNKHTLKVHLNVIMQNVAVKYSFRENQHKHVTACDSPDFFTRRLFPALDWMLLVWAPVYDVVLLCEGHLMVYSIPVFMFCLPVQGQRIHISLWLTQLAA